MTAPGERTDPAPTDEQTCCVTPWMCGERECNRRAKIEAQNASARSDDRCPQCGTVHPALSSARAENERLRVQLGSATQDAIGWRAVAHNRSVTDIVAERDRLAAENAALHESLNVSAERAAGDRRALDEARAAMRAALDIIGADGCYCDTDPPDELCTNHRVGSLLDAALAAAQPTEETPPCCNDPLRCGECNEHRAARAVLGWAWSRGGAVARTRAAAQPTESAPR